MARWTGNLTVSLNPNSANGPFFKVAPSLLFSPSSKTLIAPSLNAIFFNGDRVEGTGIPVIERLSDTRSISEILVSKFGSTANAWVISASRFNGPFAVYREFVPAVDSVGDPKRYDPDGFPASSSIATILSNSIQQIRSIISSSTAEHISATTQPSSPQSSTALPKTIILGFSKGGVVLNQMVTELAHFKPASVQLFHEAQAHVCPISKEELLVSISEIHYVDVGLNISGAYLTDKTIIKEAVENLLLNHNRVCFMLHGTPRQWSDKRRTWICKEKDVLLKMLKEEAHRREGKLQVSEKFYFVNLHPNLQMHFEIIEKLDVS